MRPTGTLQLSPVLVSEPHDVVFAEIATGLHFDQFKQYLAGIGKAVQRFRLECQSIQFSWTIRISEPFVISAVPRTATQCSERWKCLCSDSMAFGSTTIRFTW